MTKLERIKILINILIFNGHAESQKDFGIKMGYENESYFSQIINGKVNLPKNFIEKLKSIEPRVNEEWIDEGTGEMFIGDNAVNSNFAKNIGGDNQQNSGKVIEALANQLTEKDRQIAKSQEQIDRLLSIIEKMS